MPRYFFSDNPRLFPYERMMQQIPEFDKRKQPDSNVSDAMEEDKDMEVLCVRIELPSAIKSKCGLDDNDEFFLNKEHKERFESIYSGPRGRRMRCSAKYLSAIYLLSANEYLWESCKNKVAQYGIFFKEMKLNGIDLNGYILFMAAKSVYYSRSLIEEDELVDVELISEDMFHIIVNGWKLRVHGMKLVNEKLQEEIYE